MDVGSTIARALQLIGSTGDPRMQAGLLADMRKQAEDQRLKNQYGKFIGAMGSPVQPTGAPTNMGGGILAQPIEHGIAPLSEQQRGILAMLPPEQGLGLLARQAFAQPKQTSLMQNLVAAGYKPGSPEFNKAMRSVLMKPGVTVNTGAKLPIGFQWKDPSDPSKGVVALKGGPKDRGSPSNPFSQDQSVSAGYANRMNRSEQRMKALVQTGKVNPASAGQAAKEAIPYFGNFITSSAFKRLRQAQNDWIRAKLRKESGAVIAQEEMESERRTYFPMPGDDPKTIEQKRQARIDAMNNLIAESQGAYGKMFKEGQQTAPPTDTTTQDNNDPFGIR